MACEATRVETPASLWPFRGETVHAGHAFVDRNKIAILQKNTSSPPQEKTHMRKPRSENTDENSPNRSPEPNLVSFEPSLEEQRPLEQYFEQDENFNHWPRRASVDENDSKTKAIGDTVVDQKPNVLVTESRGAIFYLPSSPKTAFQSKNTENQCKIPTICLEPPTSPGNNSSLDSTAKELSNLPNQIELLSFGSWRNDDLEGQCSLMTSNDLQKQATLPEYSIALPSRYQRRLQQGAENGNVVEEDAVSTSEEDMNQREEDLGTALKWIRQEILEMKEQDKSLLKQFIELRASILQLRCLYDLDLHGSCSDISSVGSGSTYSLNEPGGCGGGGMAYASSSSSISTNINKIHINSSSNCNVLKSPHQLRRVLFMAGGELGRGGVGAGVRGQGSGMASLSLPSSPRISRLRWRSDEII